MATPTNDSYSVTGGQGIYGGKYKWPSWRRAMTAQTWAEVGVNTLSSVNPENDPLINPNYPGSAPWRATTGFSGLFAYSGGCFDDDNTELWQPSQGGHADYAGNEPYKINYMSDSPQWVMLRNPSGAIGNLGTLNDGQEASGLYFDGRPRAVHSYNNPVYIPGVGPALGVQGTTISWSGGAGTKRPVIISKDTGEMLLFGEPAPAGIGPLTEAGSCYDPSRHAIWVMSAGTGKMARYDIATNTWSLPGPSVSYGGSVALTYMPDHDCILWVTTGLANDFAVYDCATNTVYQPSITGSFVGMSLNGYCRPALIKNTNTFGLWNNNSDTTTINTMSFDSDPRTDTWTVGQMTVDAGNAVTPTVRATTGTYGRFAYSSKLDGFLLINAVNQPTYFYARS